MTTAPTAPQQPSNDGSPLLTMRAALIFTLAILVGVGTGALAALARNPLPQAVLLGAGAAGTALALFNKVIGS
jgi:hypothetical protein